MPKNTADRPCYVCGRMFVTLDDVDAHLKGDHGIEKPYVCKECPEAFPRRDGLRAHMEGFHENLKRHKCPYLWCSKAFYEPSKARRHYPLHLKCKKCKIVFESTAKADKHRLDVHSSKEDLELIDLLLGVGEEEGGGAGAGKLADRIARIRF